MLPKKPNFVDNLKDAATALEDSFLPWTEDSKGEPPTSRDDLLHNEVSGLITYLSAQPHETLARQMLVSYMTFVIKSRWRTAYATAFGSTATGLGLPNADIDLVVNFDDLGAHLTEKQIRRRLMNIEDEFVRARITSRVTRVFFARVPIISFDTSSSLGNMKVDVSIATGDDAGRKAIPLVKSYVDEMPALRPLVLCLKMFLSPRGLNNAAQSTLSSYAITLLCINFLQRNPTNLPSDYFSRPAENKAFGLLLRAFFKYYAYEFPLATHYVSVRDVDILPKENKKEWKVQATPMLSVECIINPDKDITRGATKIRAVLDAFRYASDMLNSASVKSGESLLGRVIQVPRNMEDHRNQLKTVMDNGVFEKAVSTPSRSRVPLSYSNNPPPPSLLDRISDHRERSNRYDGGYRDRERDFGRHHHNDNRGSRHWQPYPPRQYGADHYRPTAPAQSRQHSDHIQNLPIPTRPRASQYEALPRRPPSFDYMRSMERRGDARH